MLLALIVVAMISMGQNRSGKVTTGRTTLDFPINFTAADTIDASETYWVLVDCKQNYAQTQSVAVTMATVSGSPSVAVSLEGKTSTLDEYAEIVSAVTWTSTANNPISLVTSSANKYRYFKIKFVASGATQKSKVTALTFTATYQNTTSILATTGTFSGDVLIGQTTANETTPSLTIKSDADSDAGGDTNESLIIDITPNATPTLATWGFTSTQSAGYTFDKNVTLNGGVTLGAGDDLIGSATSDITINTDKFTVAGATGNTVIAGATSFTGATPMSVTNQAFTRGIDFSGAKMVGGAANAALAYGTFSIPVYNTALAGHYIPIQVNIHNSASAAYDVAAARLRVDADLDTLNTLAAINVIEGRSALNGTIAGHAGFNMSTNIASNTTCTGDLVPLLAKIEGSGNVTSDNYVTAFMSTVVGTGTGIDHVGLFDANGSTTTDVVKIKTTNTATSTTMLNISNASGTVTTGVDINGSLTNDIVLQNDETINNSTNGTVAISGVLSANQRFATVIVNTDESETLTAAQSGAIVTFDGAGTAIIPDPSVATIGVVYYLLQTADADLIVTATTPTGDSFVADNVATSDNVTLTGAGHKMGSGMMVIGISATKWFVMALNAESELTPEAAD